MASTIPTYEDPTAIGLRLDREIAARRELEAKAEAAMQALYDLNDGSLGDLFENMEQCPTGRDIPAVLSDADRESIAKAIAALKSICEFHG